MIEKFAELEKQASEIIGHLINDDRTAFKVGFDEGAGNVVRTIVREGAISEAILPVKTVDANSPGVQKYTDREGLYYIEDIESDGVAYETSFRAEAKPTFVDGKRYTIDIGKIRSEKKKKPQIELLVASKLVDMIKTNNANAILRKQDSLFMEACYAASTAGIWGTPHNIEGNWSSGISRVDLINLINLIAGQELVSFRWLGSQIAWNTMLGVDGQDVGDLAGEIWTDGYREKKLFKMPFISTIKGNLSRPIYVKYLSAGTSTLTIAAVSGGTHNVKDNAGTQIQDIINSGEVQVGDQFYAVDGENGQVVEVKASSLEVFPTDGLFDENSTATVGWWVENNGKFFDFTLATGQQWTKIYQLVEPSFLGKIIKIGTDQMWSKWEEDIFEWSSWRQVGLGFGDIRGMVQLNLRLT